ncbi:AAA family ATPase [Shewanella baltica]|uniref:AAA family ATPase n=1 Tax=Shewanella baltica TaxID=62322 RepID=UPI00216AA6ED|nr:AAA family ATPase [Shewanella baltica]MCS6114130.1 AAA family ATPase [Shewanella baltica]UVW62884.1 AAA family ATPase [Shewanella baltica]
MNKIVRIVVTDLFGFLNHDVALKEDGVTFIHGPNGCGKTTFLKLIASFFEWDITLLNETKFHKLFFYYSNESFLEIEKNVEMKVFEEEEIEVPTLTFSLYENGSIINEYTHKRNIKAREIPASQIDEYIPFLHRMGPRAWIDMRNDERMTYFEVLEKFHHRLPFSSSKRRPDWLQELQENANLHFVQTQRLLKVNRAKRNRVEEDSVTNVIDIYSNEIKDTISKRLAFSAAVSQSKDRSFPQRLLSLHIDESLSEDKIRDDYKATEEKIEKLMSSGLIEQEKNISLPDKEFEATEKKVLSLYLQDINEKLAVFDDLLLRVETFLNIVSSKLRSKTFKVSSKDGFLIETTQGKPQTLKPSQLSSGEQHQIVLFYELIFKTSDNSFFLIDEPEISLHIDWQRQFITDISRVASLGQHTFVVATHSPQIIANRRDLAIALDGGILND